MSAGASVGVSEPKNNSEHGTRARACGRVSGQASERIRERTDEGVAQSLRPDF